MKKQQEVRTGQELAYGVRVTAKDGEYSVATTFSFGEERPYEDIALDWTFLPDTAETCGETCGDRPRESLVKWAFAHFGGSCGSLPIVVLCTFYHLFYA